MKAGLLLTAGDPTGYATGDFLVQSIRAAMPGVDVVQLTDMDSPALIGVDDVVRRPAAPLARFIAEQWASLEGDWFFCDTDVVVQRDIRPVFDQLAFDLAVATREGTYLPGEAGGEFMRRNPYNCGVLYSKGQAARIELLRRVAALSAEEQAWLGVQLAVATMQPLVLYNTFNYPPLRPDDPCVPNAHVVHYKGPWRKRLLLDRIYQETVCS